MIGAGVSALWWTPDTETLGPGVVVADACGSPPGDAVYEVGPGVQRLDAGTGGGQNQLIYKACRQVDAGFHGVEYDEFEFVSDAAIATVLRAVRGYARHTYGRRVFVSANATYGGGQTTSLEQPTGNDGTEEVDYYLRNYPYRLQGVPLQRDPWVAAPFDGTFNEIPPLRAAIQRVAPKPFVFFIDFCAHNGYLAPHDDPIWPTFLRIAQAQILAAGGFPAHGRSFYNTLDSYDRGLFPLISNMAVFLRAYRELWHDLTWVEPRILDVSAPRVWTSAFRQPERTILHLVNGAYDNDAQTMRPQGAFTIRLSPDDTPTNVWVTTPDKLWHERREALHYAYDDGVATISIAELHFHSVVVVEHGQVYAPVDPPMRVVFPFPNRATLPVGNTYRLHAVQTQGTAPLVDWSVDDVVGGDARRGTIDEKGAYTAPGHEPANGVVIIRATSREAPSVYAEVELGIVEAPAVPWCETFDRDDVGDCPIAWEIVDGLGDWRVGGDGADKVLHNTNLADGAVQGGTAGYGALIVGGDQLYLPRVRPPAQETARLVRAGGEPPGHVCRARLSASRPPDALRVSLVLRRHAPAVHSA